MEPTTTITKDPRDGWQAKTYITLGQHGDSGERKLCINTYKTPRGLATFASVAEHRADGCISFMIGGDFRKRVVLTEERATEKTVRNQHSAALHQALAVVEEARAFYAVKDAAKVTA